MKTKRFVTAILGISVLCLVIQTAHAFYNPQTGRWLSRDPIVERGGLNLYRFCRNGPTCCVDRNGLDIVVITPKPPSGDKDKKHSEGDRIDPAKNWEKKGTDRFVFVVDSIKDANARLKGCKNCIEELNIQGHGAPRYQNVGAEEGSLPDFPLNGEDPKTGTKGIGIGDYINPTYPGSVGFGSFENVKFCRPCKIVLRGCNVGSGSAGLKLMQKINTATGCKVEAYTGSTYCGNDGGLSGSGGIFGPEPNVDFPVIVPGF